MVEVTGMDEEKLFGTVLVMALFFTLIGTFEQVTFLAIGVAYPAFKSFEALESNGLGDDKQWLTYWVCFAGFLVFD